jgi:hypothetical protein
VSRALDIAFEQVAAGKSRQQIAIDIGYSRPAVSRFMSGTYGKGLDKIEAAILKAYDKRDCPHTGEAIASEICRKKALAPKPFGGTARLVWWSTCQTCPHKPKGDAA